MSNNSQLFEELSRAEFAIGLANGAKLNADEYDKGLRCVGLFEEFADKLNNQNDIASYSPTLVTVFDSSVMDFFEIVVRLASVDLVIDQSNYDCFIEFFQKLKQENIEVSLHKSNTGLISLDASFLVMDLCLGLPDSFEDWFE